MLGCLTVRPLKRAPVTAAASQRVWQIEDGTMGVAMGVPMPLWRLFLDHKVVCQSEPFVSGDLYMSYV